MKKEQVIVSITTWHERIANLPVVLDTIYAQTYQPDKVVLNLAFDEVIPEEVEAYIKKHGIEVNYMADTRVYKKFVPTLRKYPDACVINIDDDCLFPETMIEDFMHVHTQYPQFPVSGNHLVFHGMQCHCGNASLTKAEHFGEWLDKIDDDLMKHCSSSDIVFTYLATQNCHPYIHTKAEYFINVMQDSLGKNDGYSSKIVQERGIGVSYDYLVKRFGASKNSVAGYIGEGRIAEVIDNIIKEEALSQKEEAEIQMEMKYRSTKAYRLGKALLKPFKWLRGVI